MTLTLHHPTGARSRIVAPTPQCWTRVGQVRRAHGWEVTRVRQRAKGTPVAGTGKGARMDELVNDLRAVLAMSPFDRPRSVSITRKHMESIIACWDEVRRLRPILAAARAAVGREWDTEVMDALADAVRKAEEDT